jgi:hypothetical protein
MNAGSKITRPRNCRGDAANLVEGFLQCHPAALMGELDEEKGKRTVLRGGSSTHETTVKIMRRLEGPIEAVTSRSWQGQQVRFTFTPLSLVHVLGGATPASGICGGTGTRADRQGQSKDEQFFHLTGVQRNVRGLPSGTIRSGRPMLLTFSFV